MKSEIKALLALAGIPPIDSIEGEKHFGNFPSWDEDQNTCINKDHYSIVFPNRGNALYVLEFMIEEIKVFKIMGGDSEWFHTYEKIFYE